MIRPVVSRGVTLIEVVVGIAVLALALAVVVPELGTWIQNVRIRNTAEAIQSGLQQARTEAIRRNRDVTFWLVDNVNNACALSSTSGSWVISVDSPVNHCDSTPSATSAPRIVAAHPSRDGGNSQVRVNALQSDLTTASSSVVFNGFGRVEGTSGVAIIKVDTAQTGSYRALQININSVGNVRMCDPLVETTSTDPRRC